MDYHNRMQNGRESVQLVRKKIKEDQTQQQSTTLKPLEDKALDLDVVQPLTDDVTELR